MSPWQNIYALVCNTRYTCEIQVGDSTIAVNDLSFADIVIIAIDVIIVKVLWLSVNQPPIYRHRKHTAFWDLCLEKGLEFPFK